LLHSDLIAVALGNRPADLVVKNAQIVNVHTREIYPGGVAIVGQRIALVGEVEGAIGPQTKVVDAGGKLLVPGFVDAHIHVESTLLTPTEFARAVLPHGTVAVSTDLMEVTLVAGVSGLKEILAEARQTPVGFFYMVPSFMEESELQTVGGLLGPELVDELIDLPEAVGLAEVLAPPILAESSHSAHMLQMATQKRKTREGHGPALFGPRMQAYAGAGITSEHESTTAEEALGKLRAGLRVLIREGSASTDLKPVIKIITEHGVDPRHVGMISDDIDALHITRLGHMDHKIRMAVAEGVEPIVALQMATLNPAESLRVDEDWGSIAPGKYASLSILSSDLAQCQVETVIAKGQVVYQDGKLAANIPSANYSSQLVNTVQLARPVTADDLLFKVDGSAGKARVRVLGASGITLLKEAQEADLPVVNGVIQPDPQHDILAVACVERYQKSGRIGKGFASGFGLRSGALASSVGHDHHNITVVGATAADMAIAVNRIAEMGGGLVVVEKGQVLGELALPICGLVTAEPAEAVADKVDRMNQALNKLGCQMINPFMTLSFITLVYIPAYGITDRGLVEFTEFKVVDTVLNTN
jgi:adenine deaminase